MTNRDNQAYRDLLEQFRRKMGRKETSAERMKMLNKVTRLLKEMEAEDRRKD